MRVGPNVYLRTDGRWEARYLKDRDMNGKPLYGYVYGKTREEAEKKRTDRLREIQIPGEMSPFLASQNADLTTLPAVYSGNRKTAKREKFSQPFDEQTAVLIDRALDESSEPGALAFWLCLHMGFSMSEIAAMTYHDIDLESQTIHVHQAAVMANRRLALINVPERIIPMPDKTIDRLREKEIIRKNEAWFILTDTVRPIENNYQIESKFRFLIQTKINSQTVRVSSLRSTFIRRCLEANLNIETVSDLTGVDKPALYRNFGMYIHANLQDINRLDHLFLKKEQPVNHQMNLLILGAGSHGLGVKEIAEQIGIFQNIKFLDDIAIGDEIIGRCEEYLKFFEEYPVAFPAFGNNKLRKKWFNLLKNAGFLLPVLIHPNATISTDVTIEEGSIVMAQATVNANAKILKGCIIAQNSMVGFESIVEEFCHVDCGGIVQKSSVVPPETVVESGEVFRNQALRKESI